MINDVSKVIYLKFVKVTCMKYKCFGKETKYQIFFVIKEYKRNTGRKRRMKERSDYYV